MDDELSLHLSDIINGSTEVLFEGTPLFVAHPTFIQELSLSSLYERTLKKKVALGAPTEKERLELLDQEGSWTSKEEKELTVNRDFLSSLMETKEGLVMESQRAELDATIDETAKKVAEGLSKRSFHVGETAERYSQSFTQEERVKQSLFREAEKLSPAFSKSDFEDFSARQIRELSEIYSDTVKIYSQGLLKKLAMMPMFLNFISVLPKESIHLFFNNDVKQLTFFQQKLTVLSSNIKYIYENVQDIPDWASDNYDSLMAFAKSDNKNKGRKAESSGDKNVTKVDLLGDGTTGNKRIFELLKAKGKTSMKKSEIMANS
jgi:hypothetical protein